MSGTRARSLLFALTGPRKSPLLAGSRCGSDLGQWLTLLNVGWNQDVVRERLWERQWTDQFADAQDTAVSFEQRTCARALAHRRADLTSGKRQYFLK